MAVLVLDSEAVSALARPHQDPAIDALVVATAIRFGGGIVVTHDPDDLRALAARHPSVSIFDV